MDIQQRLFKLSTKLYTKSISGKFRSFGEGSKIKPILNVTNARYISIGRNVLIGCMGWMAVVGKPEDEAAYLAIGDNVQIGPFCFITASKCVRIGDNCLIGPRVYIADNTYEYERADGPVMYQPVSSGSNVVIHKNCIIHAGAYILRGVHIGEYAVVMHNSVVTKDVKPHTVVAGNPACVVRGAL